MNLKTLFPILALILCFKAKAELQRPQIGLNLRSLQQDVQIKPKNVAKCQKECYRQKNQGLVRKCQKQCQHLKDTPIMVEMIQILLIISILPLTLLILFIVFYLRIPKSDFKQKFKEIEKKKQKEKALNSDLKDFKDFKLWEKRKVSQILSQIFCKCKCQPNGFKFLKNGKEFGVQIERFKLLHAQSDFFSLYLQLSIEGELMMGQGCISLHQKQYSMWFLVEIVDRHTHEKKQGVPYILFESNNVGSQEIEGSWKTFKELNKIKEEGKWLIDL